MLSKAKDFFSTLSVKEKLINNRLSQGELFTYFYLIMLYDGIALTQQSLSMIGKTPSYLDYLIIWQFPIVEIIGLVVLFLANGGTKGQSFLSKYFSFSFTVGIKYGILYFILESLPSYFPILTSPYYEYPVNILLNLFMVINIGIRIYQTHNLTIFSKQTVTNDVCISDNY